MKTEEKYYKRNKFKSWLQEDPSRWSDDSVNSYVSGINSLISWFNERKSNKFKNFDYYLRSINDQGDRDTFFSAILNILQKEIRNEPEKKSTLQNYKSYLNAFEEFFRLEPFTKGNGLTQQQKKVLKKYSSTITYTKEELIKEFKQRILTQDRISMSKTVMFPIRLIKILWPDDTETWAEGVCNKINLIVGYEKDGKKQKKEINLEKLSSITINNGRVTVKDNKEKEYNLYTSYSDPKELLLIGNKIEYKRKAAGKATLSCKCNSSGLIIDKNQNVLDKKTNMVLLWHVKQMKIKTLSDIAIDHDIPISLILKENEEKLTNLKQLSDMYKELSAQFNLKVSAKEVNKFCKKIKENSIKEELKKKCGGNFPTKDMTIIGDSKLVLMAKDENTMKSDS